MKNLPVLKYSIYLLVVVACVYTGFLAGVSSQKSQKSGQIPEISSSPANLPNVHTSALPIASSSLIKRQQAVAVGKIIKTGNNTLTMQADDDTGTQATFLLSQNLFIYPLVASGSAASATQDTSALVTGQNAIVTLDLSNNQYRVTSITYTK